MKQKMMQHCKYWAPGMTPVLLYRSVQSWWSAPGIFCCGKTAGSQLNGTSRGAVWWMPACSTAQNDLPLPVLCAGPATTRCSSSSWKASTLFWEHRRGDDGFIAWNTKYYILLCVVKTGLPFSKAAWHTFGFTAVQPHQVKASWVLTCKIVS